ncbi:MAG: pyruvate kinase [Candidatus Moranbacteria bacterium]|nr:pyruvate kinase [Candidatus Moranbacteria bacterium]
MKNTKIVATIGPVSERREILEQMIKEGMNVARLNFSHGDFLWHKKVIRRIRDLSENLAVPVGIMVDLQGPRIRIGNEKELAVRKKEIVWVTGPSRKKNRREGLKNRPKVLHIDLDNIVQLVRKGDEILIEDGLIKLKVREKHPGVLKCEAVNGGVIKPRKGVNIPGISSKLAALTRQDKEVLDFALDQGVDFVAMSFVRTAKEIQYLKKLIRQKSKKKQNPAQIVAKIERREAIKNFSEILRSTDAVMVARGDLGIEMPQADLPILQKEIVTKCLRSGKPSIVATQMLDSMIHNPRPTRAEISDVSNAVVDHADAVMLSGETADGKYPVESVRTMREIIEKTEESPFDDLSHGFLGDQRSSVSAAVAQSAHELLKDSGASAIVVASLSGFTARMVARHRPEQKILVMTNNEKTHNQLTLVWGVESFVLPDCPTLEKLIDSALRLIKKERLAEKGEKVVVVTGRPHVKKEHMSLIKVEEIK